MKKQLFLSVLLAGALTLTACNNAASESGEFIVESDAGNITEAEFIEKLKEDYGERVLLELVQAQVIEKKAEELNITEEEIDQELEKMKVGFESDEQFLQALQMQLGVSSIEEFRNDFVPAQIVFTRLQTESIDISEEDMQQYYDENKDNLTEVKARHILVKDQETADELYEKIQAGEDFGELAKEHSTDPGSAANGGDLGFFTKGIMVAPFEEAAFSMNIGEISKPVETTHGFHIIEVTDKKEYTFEEAKDQISARLMQEQSKPIQQVEQELYEEANINVHDSQFKDIFNITQ